MERTSLFYKSLLTFLTFVNYEGPCLAEYFLTTILICFDIVFAQFRVIPRTGNRFFKTVAVAECYLVITHIKNKESKKRTFRIYHAVNLADGRTSIKKEKKSSFLIYSILSFTKMAGKQNLFRKR